MLFLRRRWLFLALASFVLWAQASQAEAQPNAGEFTPRGLQVGGATRMVFQGSGFDATTRLLARFPIEQQTVVGEVTGQRLELEIKLGADVTPGIHQVWLAGESGLSAPLVLSIDNAPQQDIQQPVESLPIALNGVIRGNQVQVIPVPVVEGQALVVDLQARRLGGALQPVVRVFGEDGRQVASGNGRADLQGDVQFGFVAPKTETLTLEVQDLLLRGAMPGHYKICIGEFKVLGQPWPLGVTLAQSANTRFEFPDGDAQSTAKLMEPALVPGWYSLRAEPSNRWVGAQARVKVSQATELFESDFAAEQPPALELPLAINGVLSKPAERDRFRIKVAPGQVVRVNVWADRLGVECDLMAVVRVAGAQELGRNDDANGARDPQLEVAMPGDQEVMEVEVWDVLGQGSETLRYRIELEDVKAPKLKMQLGLTGIQVSPDGGAMVVVPVDRENFSGDLQLLLSPSIPGVEVSGGRVPAHSNRGLLWLSLAPNAQPGITQLVAKSDNDALGLVPASRAATALSPLFPWFDRELAVSSIPEVGLKVNAAGLTDGATLWQGGVARFKTTLQRGEGVGQPVRLQLMTTQQMPRKKIKKDNKEQEVDDVDRALRLDESVVSEGGAAEVLLPISVPVDLPVGAWGVAVVAELLADDMMRVLGTSSTPVFFPEVKQALSLELSGADKVELKTGEAGKGQFTGKVNRHNGFSGPVIVTLTGFPETELTPEVELAGDQTDFVLPFELGEGAKPEQFQNIRIVVQAWDADGYRVAESPSQKVQIVLLAPEKTEEDKN